MTLFMFFRCLHFLLVEVGRIGWRKRYTLLFFLLFLAFIRFFFLFPLILAIHVSVCFSLFCVVGYPFTLSQLTLTIVMIALSHMCTPFRFFVSILSHLCPCFERYPTAGRSALFDCTICACLLCQYPV